MCHAIPKRWACILFCCSVFAMHYLNYCTLEDSSTKYEMHDMYVCVRDIHGKNLVGRNHIGTEIFASASQPMKKLDFGRRANQGILLCYVCYRSYHDKQTPEFHWVTARDYIRIVGLSFVHRVRDRNNSF